MNLAELLLTGASFIVIAGMIGYIRKANDFSKSRLRRRYYPPWERVSLAVMYTEDREKYMAWMKKHPFGPVTWQEHEERDELLYAMIGSKMLHLDSLEQQFLNSKMDQLLDMFDD